MVRVVVAGVTGWTGQAVAGAVLGADGLDLVAGVARGAAGQDVSAALGGDHRGIPIHGRVEEALPGADVLVDYTTPSAVRGHVLAALEAGVAVVVGTAGLTAADFEEIDAVARRRGLGVVAAGNFSLTAALAQAAALLASRFVDEVEVIDYAAKARQDAPSGTAREMAERLAGARRRRGGTGAEPTGDPARGLDVDGVRVHSLRLPSFVVSTEAVFALPDERLSIRHDAGSTPQPYVGGTLLAIRAVTGRVGVTRGLDQLLLEGAAAH